MNPVQLTIPEGLSFESLRLSRDADGSVTFDTAVVVRICEASGLDPEAFSTSEDNLGALLATWYRAHRDAGGAADPVAEQIAREIAIEDHRSMN